MSDTRYLKSEIIEKIKKDPVLFGEVANSLNTRPTNLFRMLYKNNSKLTQFSTVKAISEYHGWTQDSLSELENKLFVVKFLHKEN